MSAWILLRGWTRESGHWGRFPGELAAALPGEPVIALDLPGNGEAHAMASPTHVPAMVGHCRTQLDRRGVKPPWHLLGLSLGAMVAIEWAASHPAEVAGCVLLNTSARPFGAFHRRLRPSAWLALARMAIAADAGARERSILALTSNARGNDAALADEWAAIARARPVSAANALRQLGAAARFRAPREAPAVPMLFLAGAADRLVDPRCSRQMAARWGAPIAVHPSAGHDLALDAGTWVASQAAAWVRRT